MTNILKSVSLGLIAGIFIAISPVGAITHICVLTEEGKVGDCNQVLGISNQLKEIFSKEETVIIEYKTGDKNKFLDDIQNNLEGHPDNYGIVLAAEPDSIEILKEIKQLDLKNLMIVHSSHQYTEGHKALKNVASIIALPKHTVTDQVLESLESNNTSVIQTIGVAHNLSLDTLKNENEQDNFKIPQCDKYTGIILGGDAVTPEGEILYFTLENAENIAHYIAKHIKEKSHLLILNGPRTGQHDQKTGQKVETIHHDGKPDPVTKAFLATLEKQDLQEGTDFTLLDFQFGKPSAYLAVLNRILDTQGSIYVAGESISMISETADCFQKGSVTAFTHDAMNENHWKHCKMKNQAGRINLLASENGKWKLTPAAADDKAQAYIPAAKTIAEAIKHHLERAGFLNAATDVLSSQSD